MYNKWQKYLEYNAKFLQIILHRKFPMKTGRVQYRNSSF